MSEELDGIEVFVAVAEAKGFRAAGERLAVSGSAVSQALRRLEERLGVALVRRTTRSVHLTEAGQRLYAAARPALDDLRAAVSAVGELGDEPRGTLRLHVAGAAESFLSGPLLAGFLEAHPHVRLDLFVSDEPVDIVAGGYDAGIRLGEVIDRDMIAVPVSGDLVPVLEEFSTPFPGFYLYYPQRRHASPALRALVDHVRREREASRSGRDR